MLKENIFYYLKIIVTSFILLFSEYVLSTYYIIGLVPEMCLYLCKIGNIFLVLLLPKEVNSHTLRG